MANSKLVNLIQNRSLIRWGFLLAIGLSLAFLVASLLLNWRQVAEFNWEIDWKQLVVSWVFYSVTLLLVIFVWGLMLRRLSGFRGLRKNVKYFCLSSLGRHIPGNMWYAAGRAYLYEKEGVSLTLISLASIIEYGVSLLSSLIVYVAFYSFVQGSDGLRAEMLSVIVIPVALVLAKPSLLEKITNFVLRRLQKKEISLGISYMSIFPWLCMYTLSWVLSGVVLYSFIIAVYPLPWEAAPAVIAMCAASGLVSLLSFLAPAGLGLKEATLAILLSAYLPLPVAILISILYRIWLLICEAAWVAISLRL